MSVIVFDGDDTLWHVEWKYSQARADFFGYIYKILKHRGPNFHFLNKVFDAIEEDGLTPRDRYNMIEEYEDRLFIETERKEGALQEKKAIAKNMLALGLAVELISQTTGLTAVDIKNLQSEESGDE